VSLLVAQDLAMNFGGIRALDGISFAVEAGEVFTIIGPNGAGKTTIFNLISRIYDATSGRLVFDGQDITGLPPHTYMAVVDASPEVSTGLGGAVRDEGSLHVIFGRW